MAADPLRQARPPDRGCGRALYDGFVEMIARRGAEPKISTDPRGGKYKLPGPVGCRLRILSLERARQDHPADTLAQVALMLPPHLHEMRREARLDAARAQRPPILLALATPDEDLVAVEVQILTRSSSDSCRRSPAP